jgi:hypothetical protein
VLSRETRLAVYPVAAVPADRDQRDRVAAGPHPAGFMGLLVVWIAIAIINIAYNVGYTARFRQPPDHF